ncbi:hypothetical protein ASD99_31055 [Mesorhizobium sp. Root695]|nr:MULTISPECIES: plasmid partition protein ParG [Mesorhizobium]KRB18270.1 hypothetical protein ASD99_31055 [Mesorhizobium sp. Root695]OBQ66495.1 hypothetical protein A9K72_34660 [Mesorhizobium loti]
MSRKTVPFNMPTKAAPLPPASDAWVGTATNDVPEGKGAKVTQLKPAPAPAEAMKRFTIDVTESLHKRIKGQCAMRGVNMADTIREMLEKAFPEPKA